MNEPEPLNFRTLHDRYHHRVRSRLRRLGVVDEALDDATQEVFAVAHRTMDRVYDSASSGAWLMGIARRVAFRQRRTRQRRDRKHEQAPYLERSADPSRWDAMLTLEAGLAGLEPPVRGVYRMIELEGRSAEETAHHLHLPRTTVNGRLARARRQMRHVVRELGVTRQRRFGLTTITAFLFPWRARAMLLPSGPGWVGGGVSAAMGASVAMAVALATVAASTAPDLEHPGAVGGEPIALRDRPDSALLVSSGTRAESTGDDRAQIVAAPRTGSSGGPPEDPRASSTIDTAARKARAAPGPDDETAATPAPAANHPRRTKRPRHGPPRSASGRVDGPETSSPEGEGLSPGPQPGSSATDEPSPSSPSVLEDDLSLLRQARAALRSGSPTRALETLDRHAEWFVRSELADAREATRVRALCHLGRETQAQRVARRLRARRPNTTLVSAEDPCRGIVVSRRVDRTPGGDES